jgi:hypothetical protein
MPVRGFERAEAGKGDPKYPAREEEAILEQAPEAAGSREEQLARSDVVSLRHWREPDFQPAVAPRSDRLEFCVPGRPRGLWAQV